MRDMEMMGHIAAHSIRVCQVALTLISRLAARNSIRRRLIEAAALLHDITKTRSFRTGESHAETAAELLASLGYPEVAGIVGQHVRLTVRSETEPLSEAEIVNYSDKRVRHDEVVTVEERFDYIMERYGKNSADLTRIRSLREQTLRLGERIFQELSFGPEALVQHLDPDAYLSDLDAYRSQTGGDQSVPGDEP